MTNRDNYLAELVLYKTHIKIDAFVFILGFDVYYCFANILANLSAFKN